MQDRACAILFWLFLIKIIKQFYDTQILILRSFCCRTRTRILFLNPIKRNSSKRNNIWEKFLIYTELTTNTFESFKIFILFRWMIFPFFVTLSPVYNSIFFCRSKASSTFIILKKWKLYQAPINENTWLFFIIVWTNFLSTLFSIDNIVALNLSTNV